MPALPLFSFEVEKGLKTTLNKQATVFCSIVKNLKLNKQGEMGKLLRKINKQPKIPHLLDYYPT